MCNYFGIYSNKSKSINEELKNFVMKSGTYGNFGCGIAYYTNKLNVLKQITPLSTFPWGKLPAFNKAIFHVRLPSVGGVSIENTHPFLSCDESFALIHNGTIYNHHLLRNLLKRVTKKKHKFDGNTDSELMVHFIEEAGFNILEDFQEKVLILTADGQMIGYGGYIIVLKDAYYVTNDFDNFIGIFENKRVVTLDMKNKFWRIKNKKLIVKGEIEAKRKVVKREVITNLYHYYNWFENKELKGGERIGIDYY